MGSITPTPPKRVAVIGAGVSGITVAKHLEAVGITPVVFERSSQLGGNWLFDARKPLEPTYPSLKPSIADPWITRSNAFAKEGEGDKSVVGKGEEELDTDDELRFAPPGPAYPGLANNVPTKCQNLKGFPWPKETPDHVSVHRKRQYIQDYAENFNIIHSIRFNTRVENLEKVGEVWKLTSSTLFTDSEGKSRTREKHEVFDNVVVASGHYHAEKVPDIPGLKEWKKCWPERIEHSKSYRGPEEYRDQTILLIGGGVSSADIGRECSDIAKKVYQSSRGGAFDLPDILLSEQVERITGVSSFSPPSSSSPGTVVLTDGSILTDVDRVIICTGYLFTLPFLPQLHNDDIPAHQVDDRSLVTDGLQLHNLHKDIFYIPDPTLSFIGVPAYTATFSFFEYQSIAVAAVISDHAFLPSRDEMKEEYNAKVKEKGYGRAFHSLREVDVAYVEDLTAWLNRHAERTGGERWEPYDDEWKREKSLLFEKLLERDRKLKEGAKGEEGMEKILRGTEIKSMQSPVVA